jgi:hypothetical protein
MLYRDPWERTGIESQIVEKVDPQCREIYIGGDLRGAIREEFVDPGSRFYPGCLG